MMDDTIRSALRIAKADGGELNSLPEDAPVPRNPDEAARMLAEHRQKIYASSQEPLKAEMEGITSSREWQDQQQEQINRQSFSPERMQRMSAELQPIAVQREGLGLPNFNTPQQDNFEAQRAVEMARAITNEENRKELKAGLKQTWPVQMAEDIYMAARAPGDALQGKLDPNSDLAIKRMFDLAGATAMQAPIAMATKPDPSKIGIFGGAGARTADQSLLKQAQAAAERGMAEQDIWRDTGWWKAPDGQWRFEIPDQTMILHGPEKAIQRLTKENAELLQRSPANEQERAALANQLRNNETELRGAQKGNVLLREAVDHPALFEAYPALKDMRVKFKGLGEANMGGYYQPGANGQLGHIVINSAASREFQRSVMAHELQHTVQRIEGFASGANPSEFDFPAPMRNRLWEERIAIEQALRIQKIAKESGVDPKVAANVFGGVLESKALEYVNEAPERLQKVLGMVQDVQSLTKQNGYAGYHRTMGEVEARNVQERLGDNPNSNYPDISRDINQTQRALNQLEHPGLTQDVPTGQQIYRSWDERMAAPSDFNRQEIYLGRLSKEDRKTIDSIAREFWNSYREEGQKKWSNLSSEERDGYVKQLIKDDPQSLFEEFEHLSGKKINQELFRNQTIDDLNRKGYTIEAFHGTTADNDFRNWRISPDDIGVHFGDRQAANNILKPFQNMDIGEYGHQDHRIIPARLKINKALETPDFGLSWRDDLHEWIKKNPEFQDYPLRVGEKPNRIEIVKYLNSKGYDGLKYQNKVEGGTSYVVFDPENQIASQFGKDPKTGRMFSSSDPSVPVATAALEAARNRRLNQIGLYSHGAETANALPQPRGTPQQMRAMLERAGVKPDELKGFDEAFAGQKQITREQAAEFFNERMPKVEETVLSSNFDQEEMAIKKAKERGIDIYKLHPEERANVISSILFEMSGNGEFPQPKYSEYTLPGRENYREVLLRLPKDPPGLNSQEFREWKINRLKNSTEEYRANQPPQDEMYNEFLRDQKGKEIKFQSSHWDEPNVLAHIRMADRTGPNGERILHIEEMQSDWAQKGRKEGFGSNFEIIEKDGKFYIKNKNTSELYMNRVSNRPYSTPYRAEAENMAKNILSGSGVPPAPYVTSTQGWTDLSLKRILKEAVDNGYESVVWTPGAEQAKRYDLSKQISRITFQDNNSGGVGRASMEGEPKAGQFAAYDLNGRKVIERNITDPKQIEELIGKEPARKLFEQKPTEDRSGGMSARQFELAGQNLSVGGEGMKGYYDKIVPAQLQKLLKKIDPDARVGRVDLGSSGNGAEIQRLKQEIEMRVDAIEQFKEQINAVRSGEDRPSSFGYRNEREMMRDLFGVELAVQQLKAQLKEAEASNTKLQIPALSLQITPKIREAVKRGLPAFKDGGAVAPTDAQIAAGNYRKKHMRFAGLDIAIENEKGSTRSGTDKGGKKWSVKMPADYGYIKRTSGADGDHVDVYMGPRETSRKVFIINQKDLSSGKFDEHKVMLGFNSLSEALSCYKAGFSDGKGAERASSVEQLSLNEFKQWLEHGDQRKVADDKALAKALSIASSTGPDAAQRAVNLASSKGA